MSHLVNTRHELFARNIAKGLSISRAYVSAGYKYSRPNATRLLTTNDKVKNRVRELVEQSARQLPKSIDDILGMVLATYDLAIESGQCAPALKACEMLGKQLFQAFTDRKEIVSINIANMPWQQVEMLVQQRYGERAGPLLSYLRSNYPQLVNHQSGGESGALSTAHAQAVLDAVDSD